MISIPSYNYCIVFWDATLNDRECRFELPNARWFDTYSRDEKYVLLDVSNCYPLEEIIAVKAEVKACVKIPTIYVSPKVASSYGFDIDGDTVIVFRC